MRVQPDGAEAVDLGTTETSPTIGITDYSRRVTDDFGVTTVVPRGFSRRMSLRFQLPTDQVDTVQRRLAALRATAATWVADDRFAWLSARGYFKDFQVDIPAQTVSYCTLTVEGLAENEDLADPGGDPAPEGEPSTFQLLQPDDVTDAVLTSTSASADPRPEWASLTIYPVGAQVIRAGTNRAFESATAGNLGNDPATDTTHWIDVGPTNRWAMFDQALGTTTMGDSQIVVVLTPASATSGLAVLDTDAGSIRVQAPGYDRTQLRGGENGDPGAVLFLDLSVAAGSSITITISAAGGMTAPRTWNDAAAWVDAERWYDGNTAPGAGPVSVGTLLIGTVVALGSTEASPTAGITDYSRKDIDDFGQVTVVERAWAKRMTANALIRTDALDLVANRIAAVRARSSLWIGQDGLDSLTVYGFFKDFSIEVGENVSKLSLSIEGLSTAGKVAPLQTSTAWPDVTDPKGTKPADNADVTGENTSKDTNAVGGRPAQDVLADLQDALSGAGLDTGSIYTAISNAEKKADGQFQLADQHLSQAVGTLNVTIALAQGAANGANQQLTDPNSDLNVRIAAAKASGDTATTKVKALDLAINDPATGLVAKFNQTTAVLNDGTTGVVVRLSGLENSLNSASGGVLARLTALESTATGDSEAIAQKVGALDAQINTPSTGVIAHLATLDQAYSNPTTGLVQRTTNLETSVNAPGTGINARLSDVQNVLSTPTTGLVSRMGTLEATTRAGGNLQPNSALTTLDGWYKDYDVGGDTGFYHDAPAGWLIGNVEHNLCLLKPSAATGLGVDAYGPAFPLRPGSFVQFYALAAAHRCQTGVQLYFFDQYGTVQGITPVVLGTGLSGGPNVAGYDQLGLKCVQVPSSALRGQMRFLMFDPTGVGGSYAFFTRPFVAEVQQGANTWSPYSAGNDSPALLATTARLQTVEQVLVDPTSGIVKRTSTLETSAASLNNTLNGAGGVTARLGTIEQTVSNPTNGLVKRAHDLETTVNTPTTGLAARVGTIEQSMASGADNEALAQRTGTLEAQIAGAQGSNLLTRIVNTETAYTDGRFASATDVRNLSATVGGMSSQVTASYNAVTDGRFASTSSVSTLVSQVNGPGGLAASVSTTGQAITDVKTGLNAARLRLVATSGGGDAYIEVASDNQAGGRILFGANTYFTGRLQVGTGGGRRLQITDNAIMIYDENGVDRVALGLDI